MPIAAPPGLTPTLDSDAEATGLSTAEWCRARLQRPVLYSSISGETLVALREQHPDRVNQTIEMAARLLAHEFDMLGSGPYVPVDQDRPARDGYVPIDWHVDPLRRLRFSRTVPKRDWNFSKMQPGNADIKYPWELSRCQHWPTLGQAFLLTKDDRFALEIARELDDFTEANPAGVGVNWTCTMDVGLRAVSWTIGLELVRASTALDEAFWARAFSALYDHGVFIRNNLENTFEVTSNHFLSNLTGLLWLGAVFADLAEGTAWLSFAQRALEHEMTVQVLPDGADYESSVPYHRLVTEIFLASARLADHRRAPLPATHRARVKDMVAFLAAVTRPDGLMPQVGDADDGRLHVLGGYGAVTPQDARHLFGPAAAMYGEPAWWSLGGSAGEWEAAWWGLRPPYPPRPLVPGVARLFPDAGLTVARSAAGHYLLVTNGAVGTNGFGNHKHNDLLSFEYHHSGTPLIVDPGSYVYTSDPAARNRFRGTAFHSTLMVDDVEQNELRPDYLFRMFEKANPESGLFREAVDEVVYAGVHHGYERLPERVTHERTFRFVKSSGALAITDRLIGSGSHRLRWHFHLAPGISAESDGATAVKLIAGGRSWLLNAPAGLEVAIAPSVYSPSYGRCVECIAIDFSLDTDLPGERSFEFSIAP